MYEVRFNNWEGKWEEICFEGSEDECYAWIEENSNNLDGYEEFYSVEEKH